MDAARRSPMKKWISTLIFIAIGAVATAEITLTNLSVAQRPGTKRMEICYNLTNTDTNSVTVSLLVSNNTVAINAPSVDGDVGDSVYAGTGKVIVWDAGSDWSGSATTLTYTVVAESLNWPAAVAQTGQTSSYEEGDDGNIQAGVAWPDPRFTDNGNGSITDNMTGLEWIKDPHSLSGNASKENWSNAITFCQELTYAGHSDWRVPSRRELVSLIDYETLRLTDGNPFIGIKLDAGYWSGTTFAYSTSRAWSVLMANGYWDFSSKIVTSNYVWPVRTP